MDSRTVVSRETSSLATLRRQALERLAEVYPEAEARAMTRRLLTHFWPGWEAAWLTSGGQAPFPPSKLLLWESAIQRLLGGEPLAYIVGQVSFGGLPLQIVPGVFIPRSETEEWACWTARLLSPTPPRTILDVGSGSGALALFFASQFPEAQVFAVDKSPLAVEVARANAEALSLSVEVRRLQFGKEELPSDWPPVWDLVVANPPYIPWSAWRETEERVRLHEPPDALFCADLSLMEVLGQLCIRSLSERGICVVEIFPLHADLVSTIWSAMGLKTRVFLDAFGRMRWIVAWRGMTDAEDFSTFAPTAGSSSAR